MAGVFRSEDASSVLAYAVMMLNTDQHSKSVKTKMTKQQFVNNLRGCDGGHDIQREYLENIFDRVGRTEIQMMDDNEYRGGRPAGTKWRAKVIDTLINGKMIIKHGRRGSPHERWVWVTP